MTRTLITAFVLSAAPLCSGQQLFNGTSLFGWEGNPDLWRVEDGVIVGETTAEKKTAGNTFLIWKGGEIGDFKLTLKARVTGNNNSGVQYRSKIVDPKKFVVKGYQLDMHPAENYIGMLYEEKGRGIIAERGQRVMMDKEGGKHQLGKLVKEKEIKLSEWNEYAISARGNRVTHMVNGEVTMELIDNDPAKASLAGILALQLHAGAPMKLEAKDIVLQRVGKQPGAANNAPNRSLATLTRSPVPTWIWAPGEPKAGQEIYARRQWTQSSAPKSAVLEITADNSFTAYVNGVKVGSGNKWETRYEFDVLKHLALGDNVLAVRAKNDDGIAGLVARLTVKRSDGRPSFLTTGRNWKVATSPKDDWMTPSVDTTLWAEPKILGRLGIQPWGQVFASLPSRRGGVAETKPKARVIPKGFELTKLYDVPKGEQGSWVSMAVDDRGRLYCGDQGKQGIFRITLGEGAPVVEKVPANITGAQGMLWAHNSLYVCLNGGSPGSGLYRLLDSDGDDQLDEIRTLKKFAGGGEHGPHAVELAPDGQNLFVLGGNHTKPPEVNVSSVVSNYGEDQLLPRMPDARGHAASIRAPGGWVAMTDRDGKNWDLYSAGFRNQYDIAFNADGEMFTYDSDMEWDSGTPWYRPTRIYHVTRGSEFGWRTGTGKWPAWYPDTLPPALDVGPGSPTGMVSGLQAKFPTKYRDAIYAFDWTYGTIYAIHLTPQGGSYAATKEEFVVGVPLNVTDGAIGKDGNFYFAVGGRNTQSALYRVSYTGDESTDWRPRGNKLASSLRNLRREMEALQGGQVDGAIDKLWPNLGHEDRHVRYAARVALEHQPVSDWSDRALAEQGVQASLSALLALARQGDASLQTQLLESMSRLSGATMTEAQKLEALRVLGLCFIRMGEPEADVAAEVVAALNPMYPAPSDALNRELVAVLVHLKSPDVAAKTVPLLSQDAAASEAPVELSAEFLARSGYGKAFATTQASNPQRQQIWYAYALKNVTEGWTPALRRQFFEWFAKAKNFKGGASFGGFVENFRKEALAKIPDEAFRKEMDELSKTAKPLVPAGYENARELKVGVLPGMKYDIEKLEAKTGEKLRIVLNNNDTTLLMHNLAVCAPGSREKVVAAALTIGPKAIEQNFVPDIPEVLASTPQVAPGRKYTLYFTAPAQAGDYPYVCTYPGHGQVMHGVLQVR